MESPSEPPETVRAPPTSPKATSSLRIVPTPWPSVIVAQNTFARRVLLDPEGQWAIKDQYNAGRNSAQIVGAAALDTDGDGTNDTAIVTDTDGTTYAFTDADGDGTADQAVVIESDGDVTVAEHTGEDEWTVTEEGHLNPDGTYSTDGSGSGTGSDSGAGSDAVWAER